MGISKADALAEVQKQGIKTYGDLISKLLHVDLTAGNIDFDAITRDASVDPSKKDIKNAACIKISYNNGKDDEFRKVEYVNGEIAKVDDGTGHMIDYDKFLQKTTDDTTVGNVDAVSLLKLMSQAAKKQAGEERLKDKYTRAKARQQEQREKKKNG